MKRLWAIAGALAITATLAAAVNARVEAPSGDTCTFTGSGTTYTVNIVSGAGVQQYGVAFGAPGLTITNIGISGRNGNFQTVVKQLAHQAMPSEQFDDLCIQPHVPLFCGKCHTEHDFSIEIITIHRITCQSNKPKE